MRSTKGSKKKGCGAGCGLGTGEEVAGVRNMASEIIRVMERYMVVLKFITFSLNNLDF